MLATVVARSTHFGRILGLGMLSQAAGRYLVVAKAQSVADQTGLWIAAAAVQVPATGILMSMD